MKLETFGKLAARKIRHRGKRSILTVIGVFIGVAGVVALTGLSQGLEKGIEQDLDEAGANKITVESGRGDDFSPEELSIVENTRGVGRSAAITLSSQRISQDEETALARVIGVPGGRKGELINQVKSVQVEDGRFLSESDQRAVVLEEGLAEQLSEGQPIRSEVRIGSREFDVVGVFETESRDFQSSALVGITDTDPGDEESEFGEIVVSAEDGQEVSAVASRIESNLRNHRNVREDEQGFTATTQSEVAEQQKQQIRIVQAVVVGIASISLVVGAVSILNTMYTSVAERSSEIGVMKAIGATKRQIMAVFFLESVFIGGLGGAIGLAAGAGLAEAASAASGEFLESKIEAIIPLWLGAGSVAFSAALGGLSGLLPARRAAKMDPADALREE